MIRRKTINPSCPWSLSVPRNKATVQSASVQNSGKSIIFPRCVCQGSLSLPVTQATAPFAELNLKKLACACFSSLAGRVGAWGDVSIFISSASKLNMCRMYQMYHYCDSGEEKFPLAPQGGGPPDPPRPPRPPPPAGPHGGVRGGGRGCLFSSLAESRSHPLVD